MTSEGEKTEHLVLADDGEGCAQGRQVLPVCEAKQPEEVIRVQDPGYGPQWGRKDIGKGGGQLQRCNLLPASPTELIASQAWFPAVLPISLFSQSP